VWACRTVEGLVAIVAVISTLQLVLGNSDNSDSQSSSSKSSSDKSARPTTEFRWFQLQYLSVYLVIMMADWLQGTNMYTLYKV
jgi:Sugar-tranasporters, 12 TM